mmetsp:Transcript_53923/g.64882  ORF Transcript_53923/g.64882 Transcript_53923/m.64882 type:complete len:370 (+) Transcript_53923:175-1284(+)
MKLIFIGPGIIILLILIMLKQTLRIQSHQPILLVHRHGIRKHLHQLQIGQQRNPEIHGGPSGQEIIIETFRFVCGDVDHHIDLLLLDHGHYVLVFVSTCALFPIVGGVADNRARYVIGLQRFSCFSGGEEGIPALVQLVSGVGHLHDQIGIARNQNVLLGHFESGGEQTLEEGLFLVLSVARDFSCGRHFHPEHRIGSTETREAEHGGLDTHIPTGSITCFESREVHILRGDIHHGSRRRLDKIGPHGLTHKRKRPTRPHVTLDAHNVHPLGHKLNIGRSRDIQPLHDLAGGIPHPLLLVIGEGLRWEHQRGVSRMHTRVLDMFVDRGCDQFPILGDSVHFDLHRSLDEIGDDHGVILRDFRRFRKARL